MVSVSLKRTQQRQDQLIFSTYPYPSFLYIHNMSTFTSSEGFMPYFCWTTMWGWICSKTLRKECFLQKLKRVLIGYRYATTGPNLIYFDSPQPFPSVANHSALALSTPSPSPSNIYAYSVNKMTTKMTWYYTYTKLNGDQYHQPWSKLYMPIFMPYGQG